VEAWTSKVLEFVVVVEERSPGPSEFALVHAIEDDRDHPMAQPRAGPKRPVGDPVTVLGSEMTVVQQTLPQPPASVTGELSEEQPVFGAHWADRELICLTERQQPCELPPPSSPKQLEAAWLDHFHELPPLLED
jgi:hypothetical protein